MSSQLWQLICAHHRSSGQTSVPYISHGCLRYRGRGCAFFKLQRAIWLQAVECRVFTQYSPIVSFVLTSSLKDTSYHQSTQAYSQTDMDISIHCPTVTCASNFRLILKSVGYFEKRVIKVSSYMHKYGLF